MITLEQTTLSEKRYGALHSRARLNICVNRRICQESGSKERAIVLFNGDYAWRKEGGSGLWVSGTWGGHSWWGIWDVSSLQNTLDGGFKVFDGLVLGLNMQFEQLVVAQTQTRSFPTWSTSSARVLPRKRGLYNDEQEKRDTFAASYW